MGLLHACARVEDPQNPQNPPGKRRRYGRRKGAAAWEQAAHLLASGRVPDGERGWRWATDTLIAADLGVSRRTVQRWKHRADIEARSAALVEEHRKQLDREMERQFEERMRETDDQALMRRITSARKRKRSARACPPA